MRIIETDNKKIESISDNLKKGLKEFGLNLEIETLDKFQLFYKILIEANLHMNLTAITEAKEIVSKHFIDSLSLIKVYPDIAGEKIKLMDMGTGAGFPAIPLAIMFPNLEVLAVDSLNKRIAFINTVKEKLEIKNLQAIHARAEDLAKNREYREKFKLVVSRAVANLSTLSEYCLPFVEINGFFIPYKTEKSEEEISAARRAIEILGGEIEKIRHLQLPNTEIKRSLLIIKKTKETPLKYPRKAGIPAKKPLLFV